MADHLDGRGQASRGAPAAAAPLDALLSAAPNGNGNYRANQLLANWQVIDGPWLTGGLGERRVIQQLSLPQLAGPCADAGCQRQLAHR